MSEETRRAVEALNRSAQSWLDLANFCQAWLDHLNGTKTPLITLGSLTKPQPITTPNTPEGETP